MTSAWRYAGLLAFALAWSGSAASAQDNPACAGIEAPLAYNACLAKHGGMVRATSAARSPGRARPGAKDGAGHRTGGRMEMRFNVGPGSR